MPADNEHERKSEELAAIILAIKERVRSRQAGDGGASSDGLRLPDLMPLVHARDAAQAKVASIGTVNPRPPGLINNLVQGWKNLVARMLDWHVREQVEFNRAVLASLEAILEALEEMRSALPPLHATSQAVERGMADLRSHWDAWRPEWQEKLNELDVRFMRGLAEAQGSFHKEVEQQGKKQHQDFSLYMEKSVLENQKYFLEALEKARVEYERLVHSELRVLRQRGVLTTPASPVRELAPHSPEPDGSFFDSLRFAERFRGSEEYVKAGQKFYLPYFQDCQEVLDIGCGRGEFLELMRENGVVGYGIDLSEECVKIVRAKGLRAEKADLFAHLGSLPDGSLDGVFSAQVVEHLPPERLPEMIRLAAAKLQRGGILALETPNPECLAIFATHFFLDPTHTRPIPPSLLHFYMQEFGLGGIEIHQLSPAEESLPSLKTLPEEFRKAFFGGLDYAILGRKL